MSIVKLAELEAEQKRARAAAAATWVLALYDLVDLRPKVERFKPEALPVIDRALAAKETLSRLSEKLDLQSEAADDRLGWAASGLQRGMVVEFTYGYPGAKPERLRLDRASAPYEGSIHIMGTLIRKDGTLGKRTSSISIGGDYATDFRVLGIWEEPGPKKRGPKPRKKTT